MEERPTPEELMQRVKTLESEIKRREQAEIKLQESEAKYKQLFNSAPVGLYEYDSASARFITVNTVMSVYSGYSEEELLSMNPLDLLTEKSKTQFDKRLKALLTGEKISNTVEYEIITKEGKGLYVLFNSDYIYENNKLKGARVVLLDITKRKQLEADLQRAITMESIGTLTAGIAHQFNNALSAITGSIDLLELNLPGDETVANYYKTMSAAARRMAHLTAQLLAYARGGKYQPEVVSLVNFVRETLPLVKHTTAASCSVDTDLPREVLHVEADLTQMQMVLSALLSNASDALEGDGNIQVACGKVMITEDTTQNYPERMPGNYACLVVTDNGKGMDAETRSRIFEPFFTTKSEGRGLGMAAVYGIVENHNGWVSVDTELDQGTTVSVFLPVVEMPVQEDAKPRTVLFKGTGTILVVEDEEPVILVVRSILKRMGYEVIEARSGQEAIAVSKTVEGVIDLVMLDILLPDINGDTLYPLLMETRPDLKVLVFSGFSQEGPVQKILNAGAQGFIQKPFTMADLSEKLEIIFGGEQ